nr:hypothetical protein [Deltaproteobacteria bacterium]
MTFSGGAHGARSGRARCHFTAPPRWSFASQLGSVQCPEERERTKAALIIPRTLAVAVHSPTPSASKSNHPSERHRASVRWRGPRGKGAAPSVSAAHECPGLNIHPVPFARGVRVVFAIHAARPQTSHVWFVP